MRLSIRFPFQALLFALLLSAARDASALEALRCSLAPIWGIRDSSRIAFIGTPMSDTVLAGSGAFQPMQESGHFGPGYWREVYGQRVRVDQIGEMARRALPANVREVVLVPWDYSADCRPVPWNRSARWLRDNQSGLFRAKLREESHWAAGLPTFDIVGTHMQPYRDAEDVASRVERGNAAPFARLSTVELLYFYDMAHAQPAASDSVAALNFARVLASDAALAKRYPASEFLQHARSQILAARQRGLQTPVAGTFRMEATIDSGPLRTFYMRTSTVIASLQHWARGVPDTALVPRDPEGYYVYAASAPTLEQLTETCLNARGGVLAYMDLDWHGPPPANGAGEWKGGLDSKLFRSMLSPEEAGEWTQRNQALSRARADSIVRARESASAARADLLPPSSPAQFIFIPDRPYRVVQPDSGAMRIEGTVSISTLGTIRVRGERISQVPLSCRN